MDNLPQTKSTRGLLNQYRPDIHVAPNSFRPISFYHDYLPEMTLYAGQRIVDRDPDREKLIRVHQKAGYHLDYTLPPEEALNLSREEVQSTLYGRVYGDTLTVDGRSIRLLFLKYSAVFPYSGLAYGTNAFKYYGSYLIGDPLAWHEGDIHGAIQVILHRPTKQPLGILLAQHNHHRVHWRRLDFEWPVDNHPDVTYARYANEPYLVEGRTEPFHVKTIGNPRDIPALFDRNTWPKLASGYDYIVPPEAGAETIDYTLKLLPHDDPLYRSWIPLGDRYALWGFWETWYREGPPGMDYYAPGWLKNLADLTAYWDIDREDDRFFELYRKSRLSLENEPEDLLRYQKRELEKKLRRLIDTVEARPRDE